MSIGEKASFIIGSITVVLIVVVTFVDWRLTKSWLKEKEDSPTNRRIQ